jgi:stage II sporulation protein D
MLRNLNLNTEKILIKADDPEAICVNERRFRGNIQFIKKDNARFLAINYIELEDYIKGVLYHEASHYWPMEALKAQAVAVRTFALYQMQENASLDYDVTSDIYSQVYGGKTSERYRTNRAVAQTSGQILVYQDKVFPAYYHATCGGHTEDASLLWKTDIVPLKGVVCGFCKDSPHFNWHYVLSLAQIQEKLAGAGYKAGNIKDVVILNRNKSGRATDLKIITTQQEMKISAKDLRNILGPNMVRSLDFTVNIIDHDIVFEGLGWGHGVGMCQWGSYFMAKQGRNYQEILKYYYPGSYFLNY